METTLEQFLRDENAVIPGVRPLKNANLLKNMDPKMGVGVLLPSKVEDGGDEPLSPRTPMKVSIEEKEKPTSIPQGTFNPIGRRISSNSQRTKGDKDSSVMGVRSQKEDGEVSSP